jgi:hypothetical protein
MIYILCPANYATGGTELLHQLYFQLSKFTINVKIVYINHNLNSDPVNERFKKYNVRFTFVVEDLPQNILILPEIYTSHLKNYKFIKKSIWWLSVDNYFLKSNTSNLFKVFRNRIINLIKNNSSIFKNKETIHFYQSEYAHNFLRKKNIKNLYSLSDYLGSNFLSYTEDFISKQNREDIVLYNPAKGFLYTKKILKFASSFKFIELKNLSQQEIISLCLKAKVYIDFGNHPGKDRFPRETAILGSIVLTNKKGSANFIEDVSIPEHLKFNDNDANLPFITNKINDIFLNYSQYFSMLFEYREKIRAEEKIFINSIKYFWENIFKLYS